MGARYRYMAARILRLMPYVLCLMSYVLCLMPYALCLMPYILRCQWVRGTDIWLPARSLTKGPSPPTGLVSAMWHGLVQCFGFLQERKSYWFS